MTNYQHLPENMRKQRINTNIIRIILRRRIRITKSWSVTRETSSSSYDHAQHSESSENIIRVINNPNNSTRMTTEMQIYQKKYHHARIPTHMTRIRHNSAHTSNNYRPPTHLCAHIASFDLFDQKCDHTPTEEQSQPHIRLIPSSVHYLSGKHNMHAICIL